MANQVERTPKENLQFGLMLGALGCLCTCGFVVWGLYKMDVFASGESGTCIATVQPGVEKYTCEKQVCESKSISCEYDLIFTAGTIDLDAGGTRICKSLAIEAFGSKRSEAQEICDKKATEALIMEERSCTISDEGDCKTEKYASAKYTTGIVILVCSGVLLCVSLSIPIFSFIKYRAADDGASSSDSEATEAILSRP